MNCHAFKDEFQIKQKGTLGAARPQTCARVVTTLDPQ